MKKSNKFNSLNNLGKYKKPFLNEFANTDLRFNQNKGDISPLSLDQNLTSERDMKKPLDNHF